MNKLYLILITFLIAFTACEKELLEQDNPNAVTTTSFWQSADDFDKAINATYSALQYPTAFYGGGITNDMVRTDLAGTESWYPHAAYTNFEYNQSSPLVRDRWAQLYVGVFRANQVLHYMRNNTPADMSSEDTTLVNAQMHFIRGLCYFTIAHNYNGAVIHDKLAESSEELKRPFESRDEVINRIVIPDFEYAYNHLPRVWANPDDLGRATWGAAAAMLGKTYLFQKDWANAVTYLGEVIDAADNDGLYSLTPNFIDNFTTEGEFNAESIFEIGFSDNYKPGIQADRHDNYTNSGFTGAEVTNIPNQFAALDAGGFNTVLPTYWLQELFVAGDTIDRSQPMNTGQMRSARTNATIAVVFGDGQYYNSPRWSTDTDNPSKANFNYGQGSKVVKYTNWYKFDREDSQNGGRSGINYRYIRYADVLLMYAEAWLENGGDVATAINIVDRIRSRAGVLTLQHFIDTEGGILKWDKSRLTDADGQYDLIPANSANVLNHIKMVERPLELAFEGHRWLDIVRWGNFNDIIQQRRAEESILQNRYTQTYFDAMEQLADPFSGREYPLFLNERVRPDWEQPAIKYIPSEHDYHRVPTIEESANDALYN